MSYTYDVSTAKGRVRFLVGDIVRDNSTPDQFTNYIFNDAEIDAVLDMNSEEVWAASADCCRRLAADEVLGAVRMNWNGFSVDKRDVPKHWMNLANKYDVKAKEGDLVEFVDSVNHEISEFGEDKSEYVGDII